MYQDIIVEEKIRIQNQLSSQSHYNMKDYFNNTQLNVEKKLKEMGLLIKYENRKISPSGKMKEIKIK